MKERMLLIYNPKAGKGRFVQKVPYVIDLFVKAGYAVEVYPTQGPCDAEREMMELSSRSFHLVVASGGDGTLDEVVSGMIKSRKHIPIGYIPMGSTNDYAASLGLSKDTIEAVGDILEGTPVPVDAGIFNEDKVFIYVAAFGAFTDVAYETDQDLKRMLGHMAYIFEGIKRLGDLRSYHIKVEADGFEEEDDYIYGMVTNSTSVGGFQGITGKDILMNDGLLEVMLIKAPRNILELKDIAGSMLTHTENRLVKMFKTTKVRFISEEKVAFTLDGEFGGEGTEHLIEVKKRAIKLVLNKNRTSGAISHEE